MQDIRIGSLLDVFLRCALGKQSCCGVVYEILQILVENSVHNVDNSREIPRNVLVFSEACGKVEGAGALPFGVTNDGSFAQDRPLTRFAGAPPEGEPYLFPPKLQTYGQSRFLRKTQFFAIQSS